MDSEDDGVQPPRRSVGGKPMDYASSGVDIDAEGRAVESLIGALGTSVRAPGQKGAPVPLPGGFGLQHRFGVLGHGVQGSR